MRTPPHRSRSHSGFALIEVLLVLVIVSLIATTIAVIAYKNVAEAKLKLARTQVVEVAKQVFVFQFNTDECPRSVDDLVTTRYLTPGQIKDPWGKRIELRCPGEHDEVEVVSSGPDKVAGTADDVTSWQSAR